MKAAQLRGSSGSEELLSHAAGRPVNAMDGAWTDQIPAAVGAVVAACNPVRIVLFGSRARGDARPDSDIDLLVIVDDDVEPMVAAKASLLAVVRIRPVVDVVVVRDFVAAIEGKRAGTIIRPALREGQLVYSRAA